MAFQVRPTKQFSKKFILVGTGDHRGTRAYFDTREAAERVRDLLIHGREPTVYDYSEQFAMGDAMRVHVMARQVRDDLKGLIRELQFQSAGDTILLEGFVVNFLEPIMWKTETQIREHEQKVSA